MQRTMKPLLLLVALCCGWTAPATAKTTLTMATLAPPGSSWLKALRGIAREIKEQTKGEVELKVYPSGRKGGELTVVRKMKAGKLDAAVLTGEGLAKVYTPLLVFQLPRLFKTTAELSRVRQQLSAQIDAAMLKRGFKLLSWGDAGRTYLLSTKRVAAPTDLKKLSLWTRFDPIARQLAAQVGAVENMTKRGDIVESIKKGPLQALVASPLVAVGLQWYTELKFITTLPWSLGIGATVMTKSSWDKLTPTQQQVVLAVHKKWQLKLTTKVQRDNARSKALLTQNGLKAVTPSDIAAWDKLAVSVQDALAGKLYPASLLQQVRRLVAAYRAGR